MSDDDSKRNYLRISSEAFSLELEGDPHFILETYDNVRTDVLRRLIELIRSHDDSGPPTLQEPIEAVSEKAESRPPLEELGQRDSAKVRAANAVNYVWIYVTHEIYNKVYVVDLESFMHSPFSRYLDGRRLRKLYIDRTSQELLGPLISTGKTLWSELTREGRKRLSRTSES